MNNYHHASPQQIFGSFKKIDVKIETKQVLQTQPLEKCFHELGKTLNRGCTEQLCILHPWMNSGVQNPSGLFGLYYVMQDKHTFPIKEGKIDLFWYILFCLDNMGEDLKQSPNGSQLSVCPFLDSQQRAGAVGEGGVKGA